MEPPLIRGGNIASPAAATSAPSCFNGAAPDQRRKQEDEDALYAIVRRFNGAAPDQRRKRRPMFDASDVEIELQWSRP